MPCCDGTAACDDILQWWAIGVFAVAVIFLVTIVIIEIKNHNKES